MRTLSQSEARQYYDRFGKKQDLQACYEAPAVQNLIAGGEFGSAESVFEFGCGTGRIACDLLRDHLRPDARYVGVDISRSMLAIASDRLQPFRSRAFVVMASSSFPIRNTSVDRVMSTYVLDLLSDETARDVVAEARRVLRPGGLLCVAGLTYGVTAVSRVVSRVWQALFSMSPALVGGCRPSTVTRLLLGTDWTIRSRRVVVAWGIASEVVIASRTSGESAA
jgi:ubiquinone/menaquinone biosynthesis C-methylase UbiE